VGKSVKADRSYWQMSLQYDEGYMRKYKIGMSGFNNCCKAKMPKTLTTEHIISRAGSHNLQKYSSDNYTCCRQVISYLSVHSMTIVKLLPGYYTEG
jgi:hypothetical protein